MIFNSFKDFNIDNSYLRPFRRIKSISDVNYQCQVMKQTARTIGEKKKREKGQEKCMNDETDEEKVSRLLTGKCCFFEKFKDC